MGAFGMCVRVFLYFCMVMYVHILHAALTACGNKNLCAGQRETDRQTDGGFKFGQIGVMTTSEGRTRPAERA